MHELALILTGYNAFFLVEANWNLVVPTLINTLNHFTFRYFQRLQCYFLTSEFHLEVMNMLIYNGITFSQQSGLFTTSQLLTLKSLIYKNENFLTKVLMQERELK